MTLASGKSLSFYEILGPLGAGGMGEVYRARDTKLDREVAIKVLPEAFATDAERLQRFEREAKTLASLNHPNVAGIHGVDQVDDTCFLALELVPGEDLATRLSKGRLRLDESLDICRQIAEGLEAAHEAGVVHRDLKPANVRITPEGIVKLLDFGLAKPMPIEDGSGTGTAQSDSFLMTEEGVVLGTPTYMSPEQARGRPVDRRTDIWALGCVLFECLTGTRAFHGTSMPDVFAAIVDREPEWELLPAVPARVDELLHRMLNKDPRERLRDAGEARVQLALAQHEPVGPSGGGVASRKRSPVVAALVVGLALVLGYPLGRLILGEAIDDAPGAGPAVRPISADGPGLHVLVHELTAEAGLSSFDLSPDGRRLAWTDESGLHVRSLDALKARTLFSERASSCAWSPDGAEIAFLAGAARGGDSTLWRIAAGGGTPRKIAELSDGELHWPEPGRLFVKDFRGLWWVDVEDGVQTEAVTWGTGDDWASLHAHGAVLLPEGRGALASLHGDEALPSQIQWVRLDGSQELVHEVSGAGALETKLQALGPSGHLLFRRGGAERGLYALPVSMDEVTTDGRSQLIVPHGEDCRLNASGMLAYSVREQRQTHQMLWIDRDGGSETEFGREHGGLFDAKLDPEGESIAYSAWHDGAFEVWIHDLDRDVATMHLREEGLPSRVTLLPGGRMATSPYLSESRATTVQDLHATGEPEPLSEYPVVAVAPDGETLVVGERRTGPRVRGLLLVGLGDTDPRPFLDDEHGEELASFSADGNWMLYLSERTGEQQAYLSSFPPGDSSRTWPVSADGADDAWFSDELDEILFRNNAELLRVSLELDGEVKLGRPESLFTVPENVTVEDYDGAGRFLAVRRSAPGPVQLYIDTGWADEL